MITIANKDFFKILVLMSVFFMTNCNYEKSKDVTESFNLNVPDGLDSGSVYHSIQRIADSLSLDFLKNGFDKIQLRLWYRTPRTDTFEVLIIKQIGDNNWKAKLGTIFPLRDSSHSFLIKYVNNIFDIKPKSNWDIVEKKISEINFENFLDRSKIVDYPVVYNSDLFTIEIASPGFFGLFQYSDILEYEGKNPKISQAKDIIEFLCSEFLFPTRKVNTLGQSRLIKLIE